MRYFLKGVTRMSKDNDEFDRDDALNYVIMQDIENEIRNKPGNSGCLGILITIILPMMILRHFF